MAESGKSRWQNTSITASGVRITLSPSLILMKQFVQSAEVQKYQLLKRSQKQKQKSMQIKKSFDQETLIKIGKGALIAATGAAALYILGAIGAIDFGSVITPIVAVVIPIVVNAVKEWMRGEAIDN